MGRRFPFPIPYGWYHVAYPDEVGPGDVRSVHWFGRDLVVWRDGDGVVHTQDAICPHLGAHLGVGGKVDRGCIRCPFHGWRFGGDGACVEIPYSERLNRRARLGTHPTVERNGFVMAWYHPGGAEPRWAVPTVAEHADPDYTDYQVSAHTIGTVIQEMAENAVDPAHFRYVHGTDQVAEVEEYRTEGHTSTMLSRQTYVTPRGVIEGRIDAYSFGPGFSLTRFSGIIDALLVATSTPVDDETTTVRFHFTVRRPASTLSEAFVAEIDRQLAQDIPIWEHKAYLPVPALADTDGPVMRFRHWFSQFYEAGAPAPEGAG